MTLLLLLACDDIRYNLGDEPDKTDGPTPTLGTPTEDTATGDDDTGDDGGGTTGRLFGEGVIVAEAGDYTYWVTTGDINGDGLEDVVGSSQTAWGQGEIGHCAYELEVYLPDPAGNFDLDRIPLTQLARHPLLTVLGDVNGDGFDDLAFGYDSGFAVYFSDGTTLSRLVEYPGQTTGPIDLGDLDGDGDLDLAALVEDQVDLWFNDGDGNFVRLGAVAEDSGTVDDQEYSKTLLRDVNGDGVLDLLVTDWATRSPLQVNLGLGDGTFGGPKPIPNTPDMYDIEVLDVDADGQNELTFINGEGGMAVAEWADGYGAYSLVGDDLLLSRMAHGDIDGDADVDSMIWYANDVGIYVQDGALDLDEEVSIGWFESGVVATRRATLADVNGDGCDDIVAFVMGEGLHIVPARSEGCDGPSPISGS